MIRNALPSGILGISLLAGCGGGGSPATPVTAFAPQSIGAQAQSVEDLTDAKGAFVIHVGFKYAGITDPTYGKVAFYAPNTTKKAAVITVKAGSKVVFQNDDTQRHTASGLGSTGFPKSFDNKSGVKAVGKTIDGGLTWASGNLNPRAKSKPFTVGPAGVYYFGCYYHYHVSPQMRDVIVAQ